MTLQISEFFDLSKSKTKLQKSRRNIGYISLSNSLLNSILGVVTTRFYLHLPSVFVFDWIKLNNFHTDKHVCNTHREHKHAPQKSLWFLQLWNNICLICLMYQTWNKWVYVWNIKTSVPMVHWWLNLVISETKVDFLIHSICFCTSCHSLSSQYFSQRHLQHVRNYVYHECAREASCGVSSFCLHLIMYFILIFEWRRN